MANLENLCLWNRVLQRLYTLNVLYQYVKNYFIYTPTSSKLLCFDTLYLYKIEINKTLQLLNSKQSEQKINPMILVTVYK